MCSQSGRGRLTKRIFGNCGSSKDCPDQIFTKTSKTRYTGQETLLILIEKEVVEAAGVERMADKQV
jgi:hypothetical protein